MTILKGIPRILPPRLLYILASMGHGDELVLGDANFPAASVAAATSTTTTAGAAAADESTTTTSTTTTTTAAAAELICCDSLTVPILLQAICQLMPLDTYATHPAAVMQIVPQDIERGVETPIWDEYIQIMKTAEQGRDITIEKIERYEFYERAKKAYAVISTGESSLYGNLIIKKGILVGPSTPKKPKK